jgi:hypothetical protein
MRRRDLVAALAGAVVCMVLAGGVAWAAIPSDGGIYTACMLKNVGTVRLIDKSLPAGNLMSRCTSLEVEIFWNQKGQQGLAGSQGPPGQPGAPGMNGLNGVDGEDGEDGVSITSELEPAGANCATGGSKFTAKNDVTYACNGAQGQPGGLEGYEVVNEATPIPVAAQAVAAIGVACPSGKVAIGGGYQAGTDLRLIRDAPRADGSHWDFWFVNTAATANQIDRLMALCVSG